MAALFADLPEAIDNTIEIARRCSFYPKNAQPDPAALHRRDGADAEAALKAEAAELRRQAHEGLDARLTAHRPDRRAIRTSNTASGWISNSASSRR